MNCKVPVPTFKEQEKIADLLHAATAEIKGLQGQLEYLKQEKKALMQQLLTGKRRVKV
jgi:type I restriction enzyme S subunit